MTLLQMKKKLKKIILIFFIGILAIPNGLLAAMESQHYVIYENVLHTFDGPTISNVLETVSENSVTVTWDTNVIADAFIIYDTTDPFTASKEQGSSVKNSTNHSVTATGLAYSTTYYYRVKSTRVNGGVTIDSTVRSFTTGAEPVDPTPPTPPPSGGGGILIIDKTDKKAPVITDIAISKITSDSVQVDWKTDENSTSFVEYGNGGTFNSTYGEWASTTNHTVIVNTLKSSTKYNIRVLSSDGWGNVGRSESQIFTTSAGKPGEEPATTTPPVVIPPSEQTIITEATRRATDFISRLFPNAPLNQIGANLFNIGSLTEFAGFLPAPILSGEPKVVIGSNQATISWTTDIDANSLVAIAPLDKYKPNTAEPYQQIVGNSETMVRAHEVTVYGLTPDTEYHFQLRSKSNLGPTARSRDFTFRTSIEELTITSFFSQIIDQQTAVFKWVTNKESDSTVRFSPYHDNIVAVDEAKIVKDNAQTVIHEIKISDFQAGVYYDIELISIDSKGNLADETLEHFATSKDDLPPEISHIKADSTVFLDQGDKIQTIISWLTNEPSTSKIYFQEGVLSADAEMNESTTLNTNYTKEHVMVITKFKPGVVYSFRVESVDSGGSISLSKVHTFMTAKKKESIIQIIIRILEQTFGWTKKLM
jgi:hypothetical protein